MQPTTSAVDHHERHGLREAPRATAGGVDRLTSKAPLTIKTVAPLLRRFGFQPRLAPSVQLTTDRCLCPGVLRLDYEALGLCMETCIAQGELRGKAVTSGKATSNSPISSSR
jgi:hypothetical protein